MNSPTNREPTQREIMAKLLQIEKEIKSTKGKLNGIEWTIIAAVIGFVIGFYL